jgi:hypothetical protein
VKNKKKQEKTLLKDYICGNCPSFSGGKTRKNNKLREKAQMYGRISANSLNR